MPSLEEVAAEKAEQAAMRALKKEIARRDRHKAAGFVEVLEISERRVADAYMAWRECFLNRDRLAYLAMGRGTQLSHQR
jgi:hypothetical protein